MSNLSYYLDRAANENRKTLREQHESAVIHQAINCAGCGWNRSLTMAYRCLYCGIYFCFPCAEKHFGMTVQDWIMERRKERRQQLAAVCCYQGEGI